MLPLWGMLKLGGTSQVQVLIHVRPADRGGNAHFELLDLETHSSVLQVKQQVALYWTTWALRWQTTCGYADPCNNTVAGRMGREEVRRL